MTEKEVLCDCIEQYIEIANKNNNILDDYISIIALIIQLKRQYPKYKKEFNYYINIFEQQGILKEYMSSSTNITKIYFENYNTNPDFVEENIFGFIEGCSSRFMFYLMMLGLIGNPKTPKQRYLLATIFERNSYCFFKQMIYYGNLYLNNKLYLDKIKSDIRYQYAENEKERETLVELQNIRFYNMLGIGYEKSKNFKQSLYYYTIANNKKGALYLCLRFKEYDIGIEYISKYITQEDLNNNEIKDIINRIKSEINVLQS